MSLEAAYLFRFNTSPDPVRIWAGIGFLRLPDDDDLDPGAAYRGAGIMRNMPSFRQLTNGKAERINFELFAQHPIVAAMIAAGVTDVEADVGMVIFDEHRQIAEPVNWVWNGVFDTSTRRQTGTTDMLTASAVSGAATRKRAGLRRWTHTAHTARHPGDMMCDQIARMNLRKNSQSWPTY